MARTRPIPRTSINNRSETQIGNNAQEIINNIKDELRAREAAVTNREEVVAKREKDLNADIAAREEALGKREQAINSVAAARDEDVAKRQESVAKREIDVQKRELTLLNRDPTPVKTLLPSVVPDLKPQMVPGFQVPPPPSYPKHDLWATVPNSVFPTNPPSHPATEEGLRGSMPMPIPNGMGTGGYKLPLPLWGSHQPEQHGTNPSSGYGGKATGGRDPTTLRLPYSAEDKKINSAKKETAELEDNGSVTNNSDGGVGLGEKVLEMRGAIRHTSKSGHHPPMPPYDPRPD